jgi:hypothetical protein
VLNQQQSNMKEKETQDFCNGNKLIELAMIFMSRMIFLFPIKIQMLYSYPNII